VNPAHDRRDALTIRQARSTVQAREERRVPDRGESERDGSITASITRDDLSLNR
jgi:hypothetical protein